MGPGILDFFTAFPVSYSYWAKSHDDSIRSMSKNGRGLGYHQHKQAGRRPCRENKRDQQGCTSQASPGYKCPDTLDSARWAKSWEKEVPMRIATGHEQCLLLLHTSA